MIRPEPGRHVHFIPHEDGYGLRAGEPHAAVIVHVWGDRMVNLTVFDRNGHTLNRTSVAIQQPEDEPPVGGDYCRWMPYTVESERKRMATEQPVAT